jgi:hypothetical protein
MRDPLPARIEAAYCRFGWSIVRVISGLKNVAICQAPPHAREVVQFAFSYDWGSWSVDNMTFTFVRRLNRGKLLRFGSKFLTMSGLIGFIVCYMRRRGNKENQSDSSSFSPLRPLYMTSSESDNLERPIRPRRRR